MFQMCRVLQSAEEQVDRPTLTNIWLVLLHHGSFSSSLISCHIEFLLLLFVAPPQVGRIHFCFKIKVKDNEDMLNLRINI